MQAQLLSTGVFLGLLAVACSDYGVQEVEGTNKTAPAILTSPQVVHFGGVPVDETATESLEISNVGNARLRVLGLEIKGSSAFTLVDTSGELYLDPDTSTEVALLYTPHNEDDEATLLVSSDDPEDPEIAVPLVGQALFPEVHISPDPLDMGDVWVCYEETDEVTVTNVGEATLVVDQVLLSGEGFDADIDLALPLSMEPGESFTLAVTFMPEREGDAEATLYVQGNDPRGTVSGAMEGYGEDDVTDEWIDRWRQPDGPYETTDFLFYVDQSASMDDDRERLVEGFSALADGLDEHLVDWQAIVVTDDDGCANGGIISAGDAGAGAAFTEATWGPYGYFTESGLSLAYFALREAQDGGCNEGFLREDSKTVVVLVSDEEEQSDDSWTTLTSAILSEAPSASVIAIVGDVPDGCATAQPGNGYVEAADATGGLFLSVCYDDWAEHFDRVEDMVDGEPTDTFVLTYDPDPDTLVVVVDEIEVGAWTFDEASNAVVFEEKPPEGSLIEIAYDILHPCDLE